MREIQIGQTTIIETESDGVSEWAWDSTAVYRIPVESYPRHITNVYLIIDDDVTMVDTGLDGRKARADLENGMALVRSRFHREVDFADISSIVLTHGHADHWGMLSHPALKGKVLYIHHLDAEVVRDFGTRYQSAKTRISSFVREAGWRVETDNIFALDKLKVDINDYQLVELAEGQRIINGYRVYHVPGHSPGHILLQVGPVLFLGDHILSETTPHQLPAAIIPGCGLMPYIDSLHKAAGLGELLGLPAHEDTIYSIRDRVDELDVFHHRRLDDVLGILTEELTLYQITDRYYRLRSEYINGKTVAELERDDQILALEEICAHLEYLMVEGRVGASRNGSGVILYRALP